MIRLRAASRGAAIPINAIRLVLKADIVAHDTVIIQIEDAGALTIASSIAKNGIVIHLIITATISDLDTSTIVVR